MSATYRDIIDAMIDAENDGIDTEKVVLTDESMRSFITDGDFTREDELRQKESIGTEWELPIESGESDYLLLENGSKIHL